MPPPPVVVVGAGAAGFTAALFAARAGAHVVLVETTRHGGKKIIVSGGGRCNVLPSAPDRRRFVTAGSRRALDRILDTWPADAQRLFFEDDLGVALALEPETGKLFPASNRAQEVRDALRAACDAAGVEGRFETSATALMPDGTGWRVHTRRADGREEVLAARAVVLATGGLSVPTTGSDGWGLVEAARLGHATVPTYPALTPLVAGDGGPSPFADLAGVSLGVRLRVPLGREQAAQGPGASAGGFLFTHRGYSGPSVLDVSHHTTLARQAGCVQPVLAQWSPLDADAWAAELRTPGAGTVLGTVRAHVPARLAEVLLARAGLPATRARADLRRDERRRLVEALTSFPLPHTGDEGYKKAEVTGGGVALGEVRVATLESRRAAGLFLAGELLDAFGPIGGYNFLWAWATGRLAGSAAARHDQENP